MAEHDATTADPVLQEVPLDFQWPTVDPFLFCVHHDDAYPASDGDLAPDASLEGREIGNDFVPRDGWRMYHGHRVPGFPVHPHRGFETVTFVRRGLVDHSDSLGAAARYGQGDVQWMTAGGGIQHAEMFPLVDPDGPNPMELFQIWVNLPAADKMVEPHFAMLWDHTIPRHVAKDDDGRATEVEVVAGELAGHVPPPPPPHSWAARPEADVAIWHLRMEPGARFELPAAAGDETVRTVYFFEGDSLEIGGHALGSSTGAVVRCDEPLELVAGDDGALILVLQGRPIGEPVAQYGPFVMSNRAEIAQAFEDYQRTGFGGWPWDSDDPTHGPDPARFARHVDGRTERPDD